MQAIAEQLGTDIYERTGQLTPDFFHKNCALLVKNSLRARRNGMRSLRDGVSERARHGTFTDPGNRTLSASSRRDQLRRDGDDGNHGRVHCEDGRGSSAAYHAEPDVAASDLAVPACRAAVEDAGLTMDQIDLLILNTITPDHADPGCAFFLQPKLGLRASRCWTSSSNVPGCSTHYRSPTMVLQPALIATS